MGHETGHFRWAFGKKNYFSRSVLFLPTVFLSNFEFKIISYKIDPKIELTTIIEMFLNVGKTQNIAK